MFGKWRQCCTVATLPRSVHPIEMTPRAQRIIFFEEKKNPRVTANGMKKSLELSNICVHGSRIRKTLNKKGIHVKAPRRKPPMPKKNIDACLKFVKEHMDTPQRVMKPKF